MSATDSELLVAKNALEAKKAELKTLQSKILDLKTKEQELLCQVNHLYSNYYNLK